MRELDFSILESANYVPAIMINSNTPKFDKRALSTTDLLTLSISLNNLCHLSVCYPARISVALTTNGCLHLLIRRLNEMITLDSTDLHVRIGISAGLGCLANITSCASYQFRMFLIEANVVSILIPTLEKACLVLRSMKGKGNKYLKYHKQSQLVTSFHANRFQDFSNVDHTSESSSHYPYLSTVEIASDRFDTQLNESPPALSSNHTTLNNNPNQSLGNLPNVRMYDLLMITKIIGYVSKYDTVRTILHQTDIYPLIEPLTSTQVIPQLRKWAITCLRNAFKTTTTVYRCASFDCLKEIKNPTIYCQPCRSAHYCSETCFEMSKATHSNWCRPLESSKTL
ncbi:hypothetical protein BC833DRAFT_600905, partial [Globomyces pollinis-pini]